MNKVQMLIKNLRAALGIGGKPASLRETANFLGVSHKTVNDWESGEASPNLATAQYIKNGTKIAHDTAAQIYNLVADEENEKALAKA